MLSTTFSAIWRKAFVAAAALHLAGNAVSAELAMQSEQINIIASQRIWFADWEERLLDFRVIAPSTAATPPVVNAEYRNTSSARAVPITSLGFRYGRFLGTVSDFASTSFSTNGDTASGRSARSELDLSLGYQVLPGLSLSYIRKSGRTTATSSTSTSALFGGEGRLEAAANLLGASANAPISERLSMYANIAVGPGRLRYSLTPRDVLATDARYVIGDFGLVYRAAADLFDGKLAAVTLQLGFRTQSIQVPVTDLSSLAGFGFTVQDSQRAGRSTTEGAVVGVGLIF